jgi:hypothetical protein
MNRYEQQANFAPPGVPSQGEHSAEDSLYELLADDLSPEDWDTPQLPSFTSA